MTLQKTPEKEAMRLTKLWQDHGDGTYPVDLNFLINGIINSPSFEGSLKVVYDDFDSFEGCLKKVSEPNNWVAMLTNNMANSRRRRFTLAHELGHFMCHRNIKNKFQDSISSLNNFEDKIEGEANKFASWLLMPADILRTEFSRREWTAATLQEIGNRFESSLQAVGIRYCQLSAKAVAFVVSRDGMILWSCKSQLAPYMTRYRMGDELPENSQALKLGQNGLQLSLPQETTDSWCDNLATIESQYFDLSGNGYQYTCIEFV